MKKKIYAMPAIQDHFRECFFWYIVFGVVFGIGLLIGIFTDITVGINIGIIITGSFGRAFLDSFITSLFLIAIAFAANIVIHTVPFSFVIVIFKGYILGRNCVMLIKLLKMTGILYSFLFYVPLCLVINFLLIVCVVILLKRNLYCHRHKLYYTTDLKNTLTIILFPLVVLLAVSLLYSIINTFLYSVVIVVKI